MSDVGDPRIPYPIGYWGLFPKQERAEGWERLCPPTATYSIRWDPGSVRVLLLLVAGSLAGTRR